MNRLVPRADVVHVSDLKSALDAYWSASTHREDQAAYHEILLFGGKDGWTSHGPWKAGIIRKFRQLAAWLDRE
jgi:hypothetical protein